MKTPSLKEIKTELKDKSQDELLEICISLTKFKKDNKEFLTYVLFQSYNEEEFVATIKQEINEQFNTINTSTFYYIKKSIRKIARNTKKTIGYSKNKESEIEVLLYYCKKLKEVKPSIFKNLVLENIYLRELNAIKKKISLLHEDLQFDFNLQLNDF